jgi:hypothetical protein
VLDDDFFELENFDFTFPFNRDTVEANVEVLAIEAASMSLTALAGFAGFTFGEAGLKRVGGLSFGKTISCQETQILTIFLIETHHFEGRLGIR